MNDATSQVGGAGADQRAARCRGEDHRTCERCERQRPASDARYRVVLPILDRRTGLCENFIVKVDHPRKGEAKPGEKHSKGDGWSLDFNAVDLSRAMTDPLCHQARGAIYMYMSGLGSKVSVLYIGHCDNLKARMASDPMMSKAKQLGATWIAIADVPKANARRFIAQYMVSKYKPTLNRP